MDKIVARLAGKRARKDPGKGKVPDREVGRRWIWQKRLEAIYDREFQRRLTSSKLIKLNESSAGQ